MRSDTPGSPDARPQRADARRNRQRIVDAARTVFSDHGVNAQMTDIASSAGLGMGTLYRHFPTKEALVHALVHEHLTRLRAAACAAAKEEADPWRALERFVRLATTQAISHRCLGEFMGGQIFASPELHAAQQRLYDTVSELVERAKAAGQFREDAGDGDVRVLIMAGSVAFCSGTAVASRALDRYLALLLDGLRAPRSFERETLPGAALSQAEVRALFGECRPGPAERAFARGRRRWPN